MFPLYLLSGGLAVLKFQPLWRALSNLPAVTKESVSLPVCLSSYPHPEFLFPPTSLSRQPFASPMALWFF